MSTDPLGLLAYIRVSGPTQSVARQRRDLSTDCARHCMTVIQEFTDEGFSASMDAKRERPDWEVVRELIKSGQLDNGVLWCSEVSRLARNQEDGMELRKECRKRNIRIFISRLGRVLDMNDRNDRPIFDAALAAAELEMDVLSFRIKSGVRSALGEKRPHGRLLYGYQREYDANTGEFLDQREHPEHGPIVREIAQRYADGESTLAIARDLNRRGIDCPHNANAREGTKRGFVPGAIWHGGDIAERACNPAYLGKREYNGSQEDLTGLHEGSWPALLTPEIHARCVARKATTVPRHTKDSASHYLGGIAKCVKCPGGGYIRTRTINKGKPYAYVGYVCNDHGHLALPELEVDKVVTNALIKVVDNGEWRIKDGDHEAALLIAQDRLAAAKADLTGYYQKAAALNLDDEYVALKVKPMKAAIATIEREVAKLAAVDSPTLRMLESKLGATGDAMMTVAAMTLEEKRRITRALGLKITLHPAGRGGRARFDPRLVVVEPGDAA